MKPRTKTIKYLRDVNRPREQVGKKGDVRELPDHAANTMIAGGYAEETNEKPAQPGKDNKSNAK